MPSKKRAPTPGPFHRSASSYSSKSAKAEETRLEKERIDREREAAGAALSRTSSPRPSGDLLRRSTSPTNSISSIRSSRNEDDIPPVPPIRPLSTRLVTTIPTPTNPNPFDYQNHQNQPQQQTQQQPEETLPPRPQTPDNNRRDSKRASTGLGTPDYAVINFGRRPSAVDPLSTTPTAGSSARQLVSSGVGNPSPTNRASAAAAAASEARKSRQLAGAPLTPAPTPPLGEGGLHQRRRSHTRQSSISLSNSATATTTGATATPLSPTTNTTDPQTPRGTRAPMESFASVEMLQGQRQHQDRTRGSEVFGNTGMYEGRATAEQVARSGPTPRRQDPTEGVRSQRQGVSSRQNSFQQAAGTGPHFPPLEAAIADIANQLRAVDNGRRESEWKHRLAGETSDHEMDIGTGVSSRRESTTTPDFALNKSFQFPANKPVKPFLMTATSRLAYEPSDGSSDMGLGSAFSEKSAFSDAYASKVLGKRAGWSDESLGMSEKASLEMRRPSIVALPVYPSPSGTTSRSFKTRVKKIASKATWLTVLLSSAATWVYLSQRIRSMQLVENELPGVFVGGWAFLTLEISVAAILTLSSFWTVFTHRSSSALPKLRLRGDSNLPSVDILIVSSGQSDQTVFDCAIAAAAMDYPAHRYRVMVLDAAGSPNLEREIHKHIKTQACPHLSYHRRAIGQVEGDIIHSRAGAVEFGCKEASSFGVKGPSEFLAVFEADVIPDRNYLRAALPTILADADVGLVKVPHGFINLPRRIGQSFMTLLQAAETSSEHRSGFILRRSSLIEIGGFPKNSWIPDGQLEATLIGHGYKVETVNEVLQWTMAAPTYGTQIQTMMINAIGPLRTASRLGFFVFSSQIKQMPFTTRLRFLGRALIPFFSLFVSLLCSAYPFMLSYGGLLVITPDLPQLTLLLEAALVMIVLQRLHEVVWCWSTGTSSPRRSLQSWIFAAPYHGVGLLRLVLPAWLGGFSVGSDMKVSEVDIAQRPSFKRRLGWFIIDPNTGVIFAFTVAFILNMVRIFKDHQKGENEQFALTLLLTILWPSFLWFDFLFAALVPFSALLFPSLLLTTPREAFLVRDHYSFVARPKQDFKTFAPWKIHRGPEVVTGLFLIAWSVTTVVLARSTNVFA